MSWSVTLSAPKAETGRQNKKSHIHARNKSRWYFPMINPCGYDVTQIFIRNYDPKKK
jgi:hypothetical protein